MPKIQKVEFAPPKEFMLPEGTEIGGEFDSVCSFKVKDGGKLCLTKLGDVEMPGYEDKGSDKDDKQRPEYGQARQMMTGESMMGGQ